MSMACSGCTFIYLLFDNRGVPIAPDPAEIFHRAVEEGERRLDQSLLELVSTSFIAGFTIVRDCEELLYESSEDAVEKIDRVLDNPALREDLEIGTDEIERRFGRERFKAEINAVIREAIDRPADRKTTDSADLGRGRRVGSDD